MAGLSGKIATDVVTPKIKETIALQGTNIRQKCNLCLHCCSVFQRQLKMPLKIENVFMNEDYFIPVVIKASTEIDTYVKGYHVFNGRQV